jgi:hypothetical protein
MRCFLFLVEIYNGSRTQWKNAPVERFGTVTEGFCKARQQKEFEVLCKIQERLPSPCNPHVSPLYYESQE